MPVIIASNQTAGALLLTRLGVTVPASATITLTNYATVTEIREDNSLEAFIAAGSILLNYGNGDLTKGESLRFFNDVSQEVTLPVRVLSAANETPLSGTAKTIDGVGGPLTVDDRVLLTAQTTGAENGVWVVKAGAWVRPSDFQADQSAASVMVSVQEGTTYADQVWQCTTNTGSDIIGTSALTFAQISGGGGGVSSLQGAYNGGNTITTAGATDIAFTLTSGDFTVDSGSALFGGTTPLTAFNVDAGLMSLDSTDTTNLTMTANAAGAKTLTFAASNAGLGVGNIAMTADGAIDIDSVGALSLNSSGGVINVGNDAVAQAINVGTGAAARTITVGNATGATLLDLNSGTGGTLIDSTGVVSLDGVGASNFTTDSGNLTLSTTTSGNVLVNSAGTADVQAVGNVTIDSSGGTIGVGTDANTGAINVGTGAAARTITIGNTTGATGMTLQTGTGDLLVDSPTTTLTGNLVVNGTTTTVKSTIVNVADSFLYLNDGYETVSAKSGGIVTNVLPTATNDTVAAGGFTAGVSATSNPSVITTGSATFAVGDLIQIKGANNQTNDGLFEVLSHTGTTLTIAGVGVTGATLPFTQNDFATDATVAGTIRKVNVGVIQVSTSGVPQFEYAASTTGWTFEDLVTATAGSGALTLQNAYAGGNTITTSGGNDVIIAGTDGLTVSGTGGLLASTTANFTGTVFDVLMSGNNGFSIDGTASSNLTVTNTVAATPIVNTISAVNTGATSGDATVDITASSTNGSGIVEVQADAINIGTDPAANATTIGNATGATGVTINSGTEQVEINGVTYYGNSAGNPTATTSGFQDGDKYYDTTIDMEMRYDATRAKWLSVESNVLFFGRDDNIEAGQYLRGADGRSLSATLGFIAFNNGTCVAMGFSRSNALAASLEFVAGGTTVSTIALATAASGKDITLNNDFAVDDILAARSASASANDIEDPQLWVKVRWRA
jgi:hypothetical protein